MPSSHSVCRSRRTQRITQPRRQVRVTRQRSRRRSGRQRSDRGRDVTGFSLDRTRRTKPLAAPPAPRAAATSPSRRAFAPCRHGPFRNRVPQQWTQSYASAAPGRNVSARSAASTLGVPRRSRPSEQGHRRDPSSIRTLTSPNKRCCRGYSGMRTKDAQNMIWGRCRVDHDIIRRWRLRLRSGSRPRACMMGGADQDHSAQPPGPVC